MLGTGGGGGPEASGSPTRLHLRACSSAMRILDKDHDSDSEVWNSDRSNSQLLIVLVTVL